MPLVNALVNLPKRFFYFYKPRGKNSEKVFPV
jgi:hypothetical protein